VLDPKSHNQFEARVAGWAAVLAGILTLPMVALYFVYSGPPPAANVLTRSLITLVFIATLVVFATALGPLLTAAVHHPGAVLFGKIAIASLLIYAVVLLFATSLEVGTVLQYPDGSLDPTTDGPLAAAMALAHGPIAHLFIAIFLGGFAYAVHSGARVVRRWAITGSIIVAVINIAAVPSMYFGMDATGFYAVNGWGADALVGLITLVWIGVVGAGVLSNARKGDRQWRQHRV